MEREQSIENRHVQPMSDSELQEAVAKCLIADSRVDIHEIDLWAEKGVVFLRGTVDSAAERKAAVECVESVAGPDRVEDMLILKNYVERTDEELSAAVKRAMIRDITLDARGVTIRAHNGMVVLEGRVGNHSQRTALENIAWWTSGVTDVVDQILSDDDLDPLEEPDY